ncbi:MAG: hypothetical protein PHW02_03735 [bacterium]|nr:hypothetical protein [bacterium]
MFVRTDAEGNIQSIDESEIISSIDKSYFVNKIPSKPFFLMKSDSEKSQILVNIGVVLFIGAIIYFLLLLRGIFAPPVFILIYLFVIVYMVIDFFVWRKTGIRMIFLNSEGMHIYSGQNEKEEFIPYLSMTDINLHKKGARKVMNILLGGNADRVVPGVTLFSGKRKRITNDAFDDKKFEHLIELLSSRWGE